MILDDDLTVNSTVLRHAEAKVRLQSEIFNYLCYNTGLDGVVHGCTVFYKYKTSTGKVTCFSQHTGNILFRSLTPVVRRAVLRKGEKAKNKILNKELSKIAIENLINYASEKEIPLSNIKIMYNR